MKILSIAQTVMKQYDYISKLDFLIECRPYFDGDTFPKGAIYVLCREWDRRYA